MELMSGERANPEDTLLLGAELIKPVFSKHDFEFGYSRKGKGSGGEFASAEFRRGDRRFEFHFRYSLGLVRYHIGAKSISHQEYMCSVLGKPHLSNYPGFSKDPLDAFKDLRLDLESYCGEFLGGTDDALLHRIEDGRARWASQPRLPD